MFEVRWGQVFFMFIYLQLTLNITGVINTTDQQFMNLISSAFFNFPHKKCLFLFSPLWSGKNKNNVYVYVRFQEQMRCSFIKNERFHGTL